MDLIALARDCFTRLPVPIRTTLLYLARFYDIRPMLGPLTYNQDGLASRHCADFRLDRKFAKAYETGWKTRSWDSHNHWRVHVLLWASERGATIAGDFVECGVNRGGYARAIIEYLDFDALNKKFWLLDTFCGLDRKYVNSQEVRAGLSAGRYTECYEDVKRTFEVFRNVRIVRGAVPETLKQVSAKKIAFLSLDMNCAEPEISAAEFFWEKLSPGAAIVLDDYGWKKHSAQKKAFDEFARNKKVPILMLPTGQGLILKP